MTSEKMLLSTLDLLTLAPAAGELELLGAGTSSRVNHLRNVIDQANVVAVGISEKISDATNTNRLAVTFYVDRKIPLNNLSAAEAIPPAVLTAAGAEAVPTDVVAIGQPQLEMVLVPRSGKKPIQPGFSIGHFLVTAGTLGAVVRKNGKLYLLSNSHVLANSGTGAKGDKILFPGEADGGLLSDDVVGELEDFLAFQIGGSMINRADCAIALPLPERLSNVIADIVDLGLPTGTLKAKRGMKVTKSGRTTHTTEAEVRDVNFRMTLNYPNGVGTIGFLDQVLCTRYTEGGDSGSLVLEKESRKAVGLHFAGYPDAHGVTGSVFNPISEVLNGLKVKLVTKPIN